LGLTRDSTADTFSFIFANRKTKLGACLLESIISRAVGPPWRTTPASYGHLGRGSSARRLAVMLAHHVAPNARKKGAPCECDGATAGRALIMTTRSIAGVSHHRPSCARAVHTSVYDDPALYRARKLFIMDPAS